MEVMGGSESSRVVHTLWREAALVMGERGPRWMVIMSLPSGSTGWCTAARSLSRCRLSPEQAAQLQEHPSSGQRPQMRTVHFLQ